MIMDNKNLLKSFDGIKDYRMFLKRLTKLFLSVSILRKEFDALEGMANMALKVSSDLHDFVSKQQTDVYSKLVDEVKKLSNELERGKACFLKEE